jgi:hypothetical protein
MNNPLLIILKNHQWSLVIATTIRLLTPTKVLAAMRFLDNDHPNNDDGWSLFMNSSYKCLIQNENEPTIVLEILC